MKKTIAFSIIVILAFSFVSCSKDTNTDSSAAPVESSVPQPETESITILPENTENQTGGETTSSSQTQANSSTNPTKQNPQNTLEVRYSESSAFWRTYNSADALANAANAVLTGTVTGISFQVQDLKTGLPPTEETEDFNRTLYTIYNIDVISVYKGKASNPMQIRTQGGMREKYVDEQLAALGKDAEKGITLTRGTQELTIGETYLFALIRQWDDERIILSTLYPPQSIYNLKNPFGESEAVASQENQRGSSTITAKDVISVFGQDKWDAFWAQWQKDNPGWESRLDKAAVEKALAAN